MNKEQHGQIWEGRDREKEGYKSDNWVDGGRDRGRERWTERERPKT